MQRQRMPYLVSIPVLTITPQSDVYRVSDTVSSKTSLAKAQKASISVEACRVLVAVVLVGGYFGHEFVDVCKT